MKNKITIILLVMLLLVSILIFSKNCTTLASQCSIEDEGDMFGSYHFTSMEEYNKADVIILPYRHEKAAIATPLVLLEAMACERKIITSYLPQIEEICGQTVYYEEYASGYVECIEVIKEHSDSMMDKGKDARERVVRYYNEKNMIEEYNELL